MNSETPQIQPFQTTVILNAPYKRRLLSDLAEAASDGYYASSVQKTEDKSAYMLTFYAFEPLDDIELRGRLILLGELNGMDDINILYVETKRCPDKNWLEEVHQAFPPRQLGPFFVFGSHYKGDVDPDLIPLKIDAATAFGSGEHDTTQLCLEALGESDTGFKNILDMGCGSAILAIGAQKLWPDADILATDIDEESVRVSKRHADMNDAPHIAFDCGDGYNLSSVQDRAPYDLIIANILTRPLIAMAPDAAGVAAKGARIILSGLLERQIKDVRDAYEKNGFEFLRQTVQNNWACLVLGKT